MSISENSIKALKDYLLSSEVSQWLASSVISNYWYDFIDCYSSDFDETCKDCGIDNGYNVECLIFCDGELDEVINCGEVLRNSKVYNFCIEHVMDLFNDYDAIMQLVKTENISVWYNIKNA